MGWLHLARRHTWSLLEERSKWSFTNRRGNNRNLSSRTMDIWSQCRSLPYDLRSFSEKLMAEKAI